MSEHLHLWIENTWGADAAFRLRLRSCLHSQTTPFQRIEVFDSLQWGKILALGGEMALTSIGEAMASEGLVHPALCCHPSPKRVLILGGGDGAVAREVLRHPEVESVTVVEIDAEVVAVSKRFFPACAKSLEDPRVTLVIDDAHRFVSKGKDLFDIIIIDATELHSPSRDQVQPQSFTGMLAGRLAGDGILIAPLGAPAFEALTCQAHLKELSSRFPTVLPFVVQAPDLPGGGWAVAWASRKGKPTPVRSLKNLRWWNAATHQAAFALPSWVEEALSG